MTENFLELEIWKPVPNLENFYEVSNLGRVRSIRELKGRAGKNKNLKKSKIIKPWTMWSGYIMVSFMVNYKRKHYRLNRLVLDAFIGPAPDMQSMHLNSNKSDNRLCNLAWGTEKENYEEMVSRVGIRRGENYKNHKLNDNMVKEARRRYKPRCRINSVDAMAKEFGVNIEVLRRAVKGKSWAHVS